MMKNSNLLNECYKAFTCQRPTLAVDDATHCLSCDETQKAHSKLPLLKNAVANDFRLCYMDMETLTENALMYYMPKLLEFLLKNEETTQGILAGEHISSSLRNLVPDDRNNRFKNYTKTQKIVIVQVLEEVHKRYYKEDGYGYWDDDLQIYEDEKKRQELAELCQNALDFWRTD